MTPPREKFQELLRELFQFDCADLDFGIYRIMNYKRDAIEAFISEELSETVGRELDHGIIARQTQLAEALSKKKEDILEKLGPQALDPEGNLLDFHTSKIGMEYLELREKAAGAMSREAVETAIFNHLYAFFGRYYQDGDFISQRRYSRREKYCIPYNGEEVHLHWANRDQYYVKTGEHFHDYRYKDAYGTSVHFKLDAADVEQNNVKGDKRFFLPRISDMEWSEEAGELTIPFDYRPLAEAETETYGKKNQQEKIIEMAVEAIPQTLKPGSSASLSITAEKRKDADGRAVSLLEHHLRRYTRKNTSDFFIHKDLKGFLNRELDFYLKNEVLNVDDLLGGGEFRAGGWFQVVKTMKDVGARIIGFLDQIESFQKMLWEKRKFVTETQYCITVGNIGEDFYPEIAACDAQWAEWKALFHLDEEREDLFSNGKRGAERRAAMLRENPTLVVDTRYFGNGFADRLLRCWDDLDDATDGLLVHAENWQALNLLADRFRGQAKCIYIDPPYNTGDDEFLYRDSYRKSCWLSMIDDRCRASRPMLTRDATFFSSIDDSSYWQYRPILDSLFGEENYLSSFVWRRRASSAMAGVPVSLDHEYLLSFARDIQSIRLTGLTRRPEAYPYEDEKGRYASTDLTVGMTREERPGQFYPIQNPRTGTRYDPNPNRVWRFFPGTMNEIIERDLVIWPDESKGQLNRPRYKTYFDPGNLKPMPLSSWIATNGKNDSEWKDGESEYGTAVLTGGMNQEGGRNFSRLFGHKGATYPKPVSLIRSLLRATLGENDLVLDFFAGAGTTGHAAISLFREDGLRRRFALVELAAYFDTFLLPLIKKVIFTPAWKDGNPKRTATPEEAARSPRIVKYIRLESYEDALNNIQMDETDTQAALQFDDYLLKYMLRWESRKSETLLNIEKLTRPFDYRLTIADGGATVQKPVDIPETFNYLLGLHVQTRKVHFDEDRRYLVYRGKIGRRRVAVIWRDTHGWEKVDLERDKAFVAEQKLTEGADEVFVNGDSFIPKAKALEPTFKARMFAPVEG